jgi:formylglycine-generating enzyme required for sulfatase activity
MVLIPAGEFVVGTGEAKNIYLDAFYLDQYEVTNAMWDGLGVSKRRPKSLCDRCPVINVSWFEAESYCKKVSKRLPTEFEWEKAARGPDGLAYVWGYQFRPGLTNVKSDSDKFSFTAPIGSFSFDKSPYGVLDLAGNVSEWTSSLYQRGYYATMPRSNPRGPDRGDFRIYRGGSWESREEKTQATTRDWSFPEERYETVGFRCAKGAS